MKTFTFVFNQNQIDMINDALYAQSYALHNAKNAARTNASETKRINKEIVKIDEIILIIKHQIVFNELLT